MRWTVGSAYDRIKVQTWIWDEDRGAKIEARIESKIWNWKNGGDPWKMLLSRIYPKKSKTLI